jgi:predicted ATPase
VTFLELSRLDVAHAEELVVQTTGGKALPDEVLRRIVKQTDGVPLFIEATTQAIVESGVLDDRGARYVLIGPLPATMVPTSLQGALMARLDRLGTAKSVLQLGATIGREFSYALLRAVSLLDETTLEHELRRALTSGLLQQQGSMFVFRHSLVQETAYQSLLRATRQTHHQRIATVLENRFPDLADEHPQLLARHHTEAGNVPEAIPYWQKAGAQAIARAAFAEAIADMSTGLRLLASLPATAARDRQELQFQTALGMALQAHRGYAAPEVDQAYTRARDLCRHTGDVAELVSVLRGQHLFYGVRAEYQTAMQISRQMLELAERDGTSRYTIEAHLALGLYSIYLGDFVGSRRHLESGTELYEAGTTSFESFHYVGHSAAMCHAYLGRTLCFLGCADEANLRSVEGLHLARTLSIPLTIAQTMGMHTLLLQMQRDTRAAREWSQKTRDYAAEHGFPYWISLCSIVQAWLTAEDDDIERGIVLLRQGIERYLATGARLGLSWFLGMLAETLARSGRVDEGLAALADAAAHVRTTGERYYAAEVERLRGELLLQQQGPDARAQAEACFHRALQIARRQCAKLWELRAATSLARLWCDEGRRDDARVSLAGLYATFTEGLNRPDLISARRLLDDLVSPT